MCQPEEKESNSSHSWEGKISKFHLGNDRNYVDFGVKSKHDFNIQRPVCSQLYIHDMMSYTKLYYKQKDTTMTSISKGMFASNYDAKSWQQIVSQGKNLRLN